MSKESKNSTLVHAGRSKNRTFGIVNPPVFHASTVVFDTLDEMKRAGAAQHEIMSYGRRGTPTSFALCEALTELSDGAGTVLYGSGLAAVTHAILAFVATGDHVLIPDAVYEPTRQFADEILSKFGVAVTYYDPLIGSGIAALIRPETKVVFVESPGSITMEVQDVPAIADAAHKAGAVVILDNTWATPLLFDAFAHGVDVSVLSLTKYMVGHADALLGSATANAATIDRLRKGGGLLGTNAAPDDVYLALRGMRTLAVRMKQHQAAALEIAHWLDARPEVDHLRHPAFPSCPGHDIWKRDFSGSSGLFSFVLKDGNPARVKAFLEGMTYFKMGFSWGGYESLALAYGAVTKIRTASHWDGATVIRLHIGLEEPQDLIADLEAAFGRYHAV
ncbi:cystathionine beta-lyase [Govanella unica]|uniref:Cystathionine beta-lyase n=1 Tax=Govanella unica TaxID=2975056 RepID=A0A9X3Z7Q3_9PROT|nr:cystathionine beta-lyase [Govania unica]MDA5194298.1 cystathionine beta-lyase [Govania unica]